MNFRKKPDPHGNCEFDEETGTVKNCLVGLESANKFACDPRVPNYATLKGITVDQVVELLRKIFQHPRTSRFCSHLDTYHMRHMKQEGCIFPMVILSKFDTGQYRDDGHREDAPHFTDS